MMRIKFAIPALAILATTLAAPAFAQDARVYGGAGYYGPSHEGSAYRHRVYRGGYDDGPAIGPLFYGDGWVPESIYDHSRSGGIDPNIRPSN